MSSLFPAGAGTENHTIHRFFSALLAPGAIIIGTVYTAIRQRGHAALDEIPPLPCSLFSVLCSVFSALCTLHE